MNRFTNSSEDGILWNTLLSIRQRILLGVLVTDSVLNILANDHVPDLPHTLSHLAAIRTTLHKIVIDSPTLESARKTIQAALSEKQHQHTPAYRPSVFAIREEQFKAGCKCVSEFLSATFGLFADTSPKFERTTRLIERGLRYAEIAGVPTAEIRDIIAVASTTKFDTRWLEDAPTKQTPFSGPIIPPPIARSTFEFLDTVEQLELKCSDGKILISLECDDDSGLEVGVESLTTLLTNQPELRCQLLQVVVEHLRQRRSRTG